MNMTLVYVIGAFMEAFIFFQYSISLLKTELNYIKLICAISICYIILFIVMLSENSALNIVAYLLVNFCYLMLCFKVKWYVALFHVSLLTGIMSLSELVAYSILKFWITTFAQEVRNAEHFFWYMVLSKLIFSFGISFIIHYGRNKSKNGTGVDYSSIFLSFIPISSAFVVLTYVSVGEKIILSEKENVMMIISSVLLLIINVVVFGINQYTNIRNEKYMEVQMLLQKEEAMNSYNEMVLSQYENQNIMIHDMKKHLHSIDILNNEKEYDRVHTYIKQIINSPELKLTKRICEHKMLNAVLCNYYEKCLRENISFHADIRSGLINMMSDKDMTSLFSNLIENALEACIGVEDSYIELYASKRENTPFVVITVINTCLISPFEKDTSKMISTKKDKGIHGYGVKSINKIVKQYDGDIKMYYNESTKTFHTIINLNMVQAPK